MDEQTAVDLALDAYKALDSIGKDVAQIKELGVRQLEILQQPAPEEVPSSVDSVIEPLSDDADWVTEVHSTVEVPAGFFPDLMGFQYMQTVLSVFLLVAFLLNLGATLWLAFSDKWRS